jgi:hypothetical protein
LPVSSFESRMRTLDVTTSLRRTNYQADSSMCSSTRRTSGKSALPSDEAEAYDLEDLSYESVALSRTRAMELKQAEQQRQRGRAQSGKDVQKRRKSMTAVARAQVH